VLCSIELTISYVYLALHSYADRDNVGLPGFAAWFKDESDGERDHAQLLLNFQVSRCHRNSQVSVPVWPGSMACVSLWGTLRWTLQSQFAQLYQATVYRQSSYRWSHLPFC
jgi:Ferritin-like domain